jgi:methylmalonyl-CoA/ethylmalonyl-CoA epimerase
MIQGIHHINFIVRDLDAAIKRWEHILGMAVTSRDALESRGVELARFRLAGTWIVLVHPVRAGTEPARFLETHGEGFFLMSLQTESLAGEIDRIGASMTRGEQRSGLDDWQVIDLDVDQTLGAQLQLVATESN